MANLSNINNKFLVTTGGNVLIGQTAAVGTSKLQVTGTMTADTVDGTVITDGFITMGFAQINRYGAAIELQYTPTNAATLVKIGANGSNPTIFNAYTGDATFAGTIQTTGANLFYLGKGVYTKATNASNDVDATNIWGYGLYEGAVILGELSTIRDGTVTLNLGTTYTTGKVVIRTDNKVTALTIDASQNATFAGQVSVGNYAIPSDHQFQIAHLGQSYARFALTNSQTGNGSSDGLIFQMENLNSIFKNQENGSLAFGTNGRETDLYINSSGSINIGSRRAALPSNFGYSSSYKVLILGSSGTNYQTDAVTLSLGVDVTGNPSGAFNGNGREIIIRNEGSFISPNAANNGYNSILSWNSSGQPYFSQNVGIGTTGPGTKLDIAVTPSAPWMKLINEDEPAFNLTTYNNGTNNGSTVYAFKHGLYYGNTENAAIAFYRGGSSVGGFLAFTTDNGTERMRITSAGDVTIGNFTPGNPSRLNVRGTGTYNTTFSRPGATVQIISDELTNDTWSPVLNIANVRQSLTTGKDSFGGIGFSSIDDSNNAGIFDAARIALINEAPSAVTTPTALAFYTNVGTTQSGAATERMRITSGGEVLIGTDNALAGVDGSTVQGVALRPEASILASRSGDVSLILNRQTSVGSIAFLRYNGTTVGSISVTASTTAYNTSSDYRLKEDLQDFAGLDMVSKIPVYDFKWKTDESRSYGVMAHELQEVLPDAVSGEKDAEEMQGVDYSKIVPLLVKSIQELKAEVDKLKQECKCKN